MALPDPPTQGRCLFEASPSAPRCRYSLDYIADSSPGQIEEVKGVNQVLDQEEEVAAKEFAKFEEKLRQQRGESVAPSPAAGE